jgi:predicted kinase
LRRLYAKTNNHLVVRPSSVVRRKGTAVHDFKPEAPILYIFSGLPGSGKSTLSQLVARQRKAVYLRIDTIEQAMRELCSFDVQGEGYRLAYRIASENLRLGVSVVADSCNPIELTRREWEQVARDARAEYINIEIVCSDSSEHRQRVEARVAEVPGLKLPTWGEIERREYHDWTVERVIVDTAGRSATECASDLISSLSRLRA